MTPYNQAIEFAISMIKLGGAVDDAISGALLASSEPIGNADEFRQHVNDIVIANKCARSAGAVWAKAITPKYVGVTSNRDEMILDFGAGPRALHTLMLRDKGFPVVAHDFGLNFDPCLHSKQALALKYPTVFASNVLNVQASMASLMRTVREIAGAVKPGGRAVFNYPESPRKLAGLSPAGLNIVLSQHFGRIDMVGGTDRAPLLEVHL